MGEGQSSLSCLRLRLPGVQGEEDSMAHRPPPGSSLPDSFSWSIPGSSKLSHRSRTLLSHKGAGLENAKNSWRLAGPALQVIIRSG